MTTLSSAIAGYPRDKRHQFIISDAFFEFARSRAQAAIGNNFKGCGFATEVANSALNATLQRLANGKFQSTKPEDFERVLKRIVRNKLADRFRHNSRKQRDRGRLASVEPEFLANLATKSDDPSTSAALNELCDPDVLEGLFEAAYQLLEKQFGGHRQADKLRLWVANIAICGHVSAAAIRLMMKERFPNDVPYSRRNILVIRARARKLVYAWLLEIEAEDE